MKNVCLLIYNMKDDTGIPNHNYSIRQKTNYNIIVLKIKIDFEQYCPKYTFIKYLLHDS